MKMTCYPNSLDVHILCTQRCREKKEGRCVMELILSVSFSDAFKTANVLGFKI